MTCIILTQVFAVCPNILYDVKETFCFERFFPITTRTFLSKMIIKDIKALNYLLQNSFCKIMLLPIHKIPWVIFDSSTETTD